MANPFDAMLKEIGAGIADVREKLVEEPWYGRSLSEAPAPAESNPFEKALADVVRQSTPEVAREMPQPGGGMEH